jgi:hypothetical protein
MASIAGAGHAVRDLMRVCNRPGVAFHDGTSSSCTRCMLARTTLTEDGSGLPPCTFVDNVDGRDLRKFKRVSLAYLVEQQDAKAKLWVAVRNNVPSRAHAQNRIVFPRPKALPTKASKPYRHH